MMAILDAVADRGIRADRRRRARLLGAHGAKRVVRNTFQQGPGARRWKRAAYPPRARAGVGKSRSIGQISELRGNAHRPLAGFRRTEEIGLAYRRALECRGPRRVLARGTRVYFGPTLVARTAVGPKSWAAGHAQTCVSKAFPAGAVMEEERGSENRCLWALIHLRRQRSCPYSRPEAGRRGKYPKVKKSASKASLNEGRRPRPDRPGEARMEAVDTDPLDLDAGGGPPRSAVGGIGAALMGRISGQPPAYGRDVSWRARGERGKLPKFRPGTPRSRSTRERNQKSVKALAKEIEADYPSSRKRLHASGSIDRRWPPRYGARQTLRGKHFPLRSGAAERRLIWKNVQTHDEDTNIAAHMGRATAWNGGERVGANRSDRTARRSREIGATRIGWRGSEGGMAPGGARARQRSVSCSRSSGGTGRCILGHDGRTAHRRYSK